MQLFRDAKRAPLQPARQRTTALQELIASHCLDALGVLVVVEHDHVSGRRRLCHVSRGKEEWVEALLPQWAPMVCTQGVGEETGHEPVGRVNKGNHQVAKYFIPGERVLRRRHVLSAELSQCVRAPIEAATQCGSPSGREMRCTAEDARVHASLGEEMLVEHHGARAIQGAERGGKVRPAECVAVTVDTPVPVKQLTPQVVRAMHQRQVLVRRVHLATE
eukprot:CAMPEP_0174750946 /NCGR_PEP_ID=MMETSP1094-20130205/98806_1 /TAXON_ID=156173 /ORGANISM="Chrysochromulina brevifilum, Strain UTEX LB 985" /LENGTH=218 /DNA_ID=CAMNT_0015956361 /DNA_START=207 /DNA_END=863 /DNA_ORIENTATION=-